jgi:superfamily II DNA helicase RecQ
LFTGISNVLFGAAASWDAVLSATGEVAEMAGHSSDTHMSSYGSAVLGGRENLHHVFHRELGGEAALCLSSELSSAELLNGLRAVVGPSAEYTSVEQKEMVRIIANEKSRHAHIGMPCGSGKSMAWMVPTVAGRMAGKERQTIVVVVPCKFLVSCHINSATDQLCSKWDVSILGFTGSDIRQSTILPEGLRNSSSLPDMLFLSLEGMANMLQFHPTTFKGWVEDKAIQRFIIDEAHTMLGETFRSGYEILPSLARHGVPIATMSGTVPGGVIPFLVKHLGLSADDALGDIDIINIEDCVGESGQASD